jgi:hypothetical protein
LENKHLGMTKGNLTAYRAQTPHSP